MMLRPTATKVVPTSDYQLIVTFDNGEKRRFDVKPYIKGSWYGNLKDPGTNPALPATPRYSR